MKPPDVLLRAEKSIIMEYRKDLGPSMNSAWWSLGIGCIATSTGWTNSMVNKL